MIRMSVADAKKELLAIKDGVTAKEIAEMYNIPNYKDLIFEITEAQGYSNGEIDRAHIHPTELFSELFPYKFEALDVPEEVQNEIEEWEGMYYYVHAMIQIPELVPLLGQLDLDDLTISNQGGCYQNLEFVYLPTSDLAEHEDEIVSEFAKQPGSFMLAIQDEGYHTYEHFLRFYMEVKALGLTLQNMIDKSKEAAKEVAKKIVVEELEVIAA